MQQIGPRFVTVSSSQNSSSAYRIPRGLKQKHRPIDIHFATHRVRDAIYRARRGLRDNSHPSGGAIYINEHLTKGNTEIFARARSLMRDKRISKAWTMAGFVFIKHTNSEADKPRRILSLQDFAEI